MGIWEERRNIEKRIKSILSDKKLDYFFEPYELKNIDNKGGNYYKTLEIFKLLFEMGEEARIYLRNEMWSCFNDSAEIDKNDYSNEEYDFIQNISSFYHAECQKYGEDYQVNQNINIEYQTKRLLLRPFDDKLNNSYIDFFFTK